MGDENYESNCYSGEQLPLMGVTGVQSTLRSISGHYSVTKHVNQGVMKWHFCQIFNTYGDFFVPDIFIVSELDGGQQHE